LSFFSGGNNSTSSVNFTNANKSSTTVATSVGGEVPAPMPMQVQSRIRSTIYEQPSGFVNGNEFKRQSSLYSNLLPVGSIGPYDRRPSAPTFGDQPKIMEQRRPSLPLGARASDSGA
jgi:hypothetical protein